VTTAGATQSPSELGRIYADSRLEGATQPNSICSRRRARQFLRAYSAPTPVQLLDRDLSLRSYTFPQDPPGTRWASSTPQRQVRRSRDLRTAEQRLSAPVSARRTSTGNDADVAALQAATPPIRCSTRSAHETVFRAGARKANFQSSAPTTSRYPCRRTGANQSPLTPYGTLDRTQTMRPPSAARCSDQQRQAVLTTANQFQPSAERRFASAIDFGATSTLAFHSIRTCWSPPKIPRSPATGSSSIPRAISVTARSGSTRHNTYYGLYTTDTFACDRALALPPARLNRRQTRSNGGQLGTAADSTGTTLRSGSIRWRGLAY